MAFKETKRKGFNFYRSYYDVYNEIESDKAGDRKTALEESAYKTLDIYKGVSV